MLGTLRCLYLNDSICIFKPNMLDCTVTLDTLIDYALIYSMPLTHLVLNFDGLTFD